MKNRTRKRLNQRWQALNDVFVDGWRREYLDIQEFILPQRGRFLLDDANRKRARGTLMLNTIALRMADACAAGLLTGLTSPARPWLELTNSGRKEDISHEMQDVYDRDTFTMLAIFQASNFYGALHTMYRELAGFGTACGLLLRDYENVIRIHTYTCGEYRLGTDHRGVVTEVMTQAKWSAEQIWDEFSDDLGSLENAPDALQRALARTGEPKTEFTLCHYVGKSHDEANSPSQKGKPFVSDYWIAEGSESDERFLARRGFSYNPILAPRWQTIGLDAYGRGPGINALPTIKMLQAMEKNRLTGLERMVDPPLQQPAWMSDRTTDLTPGAVNVVPPLGRNASAQPIQSLYQVNLPLDQLDLTITRYEQVVSEMFFNHVFSMFSSRDMSDVNNPAIQEMSDEKLLQLGPVVSMLTTELLDPIVAGAYHLMEEAGLTAERPEDVDDPNLETQYISILAQAQRATSLGQIERAMAGVGQIAQLLPGALDRVNVDALVEDIFEQAGLPQRALRSMDEAEETRRERAEAARAEQQAEMAAKGAGAVRSLGTTPINGPEETVLDAALGPTGLGVQ